VTLADFAADVRAPTPSAAAELVVPDRVEFAAALARGADRMHGAAARAIATAGREVAAERRVLDRLHPAAALGAARERAGDYLDRATRAIRAVVGERRRLDERFADRLPTMIAGRTALAGGQLAAASAALGALGPGATLGRGYAIVRRAVDGRVVRDPIEAVPGTGLLIRVARGEFAAQAGDARAESTHGKVPGSRPAPRARKPR
jgi:exodeoxyribonuclease VII large subunit